MTTTMDDMRTVASRAWGVFAVLTLLCSVNPASAFNLDTEHFTQYYGRRQDDMFGFSVALHKEARTGESWVLVGAPEAQSERLRTVQRGGAVYRCDISAAQCAEVPFDQSEGNNRNATYHDIDNKSHQWFGATIAAAESGSAVVACAPRYVNYPNTREERHDPVGTCWVARDQFARFNEYSPCRTSEWGYHRKGHCQAGLGASISKDGTQLFIGAPGSHYWQGQLFTVNATVFMPFLPPESIRVNTTSGQLFAENLHRRPEVYETPEGPSTDDDTYLGYSVAVGYFEGPGNTTVAVGRPRGDHLKGKVEIYSWDLVQLVDISGDQLGGYFGYSLCASDMDGDGRDDLVVGAPLFTERNNEGKYETGRIYIMYQKDGYEGNDTRDGVNSRSRFGLSLCSIGDVNKDGYGDIAVGAPYDNPEGRGAVYIYLGSKEGIREKPSQIIYAKDISRDFSTFGFSVSGGLDLDNNYYPDLVIGAYESNSAAFFRARPIVKVDANVTFIRNESGTFNQINLKNLNCNLQGSGEYDAICFAVRSCLQFDGLGVENWHYFNVEVVLDSSKPRSSRMFFQDSPQRGNSRNFTARTTKKWPLCRDFNVYIKPNIRDKLTPLNVEMRYSLQPSRSRSQTLAPVLDLVLPPVKKDTLNIVKNCGSDNICIPDLKMKIIPSVEQYLLGSGEDFKLKVLVENRAEDAFEASYSLKLPRGLNYINIARTDKNEDVTVQCSAPSQSSNNTLICDIGNPLPSTKYVEFEVLMQPFYAEGLHSQYHFEMEVNSTNPEKAATRRDNKRIMDIPIRIQTDSSLMGASYPSDVHWNSVDYSKTEGFKEEAEIGPQVVHVHTIHNKGPADIVEAEVFIVVPTSTFANDNILYLLEQPETDGPIRCEKVPEANFLNLKLDSRRLSYFEGHERLSGSGEAFVSGETSSSSSSTAQGSISTYDQNSRGHWSSREEDAPSEGGRRRGGSATNEITYHGHGGSRKLVGVDGERTIHKDEGIDVSAKGTFGEGESGYSFQQSSQSFQNSSQSSRRVETQGGRSGPKVHTSTNFSASWSENDGPVHHYENHTSEGGTHMESSGKHHNGRDQSTSQHQSSSGRSRGWVDYNESRTYDSNDREVDQSGKGYYDSSRTYQNRTRGYSGTGSSDTYHGSSGQSHSSRGPIDNHRGGLGYQDTGYRDNADNEGNARGHYDQTGNNRYPDNQGSYHGNEEDDYENNEDYHDNDGGYHEYESRHHENTQDESRRQGYASRNNNGGYREYESRRYDSTQDIGRTQGHGSSRDNDGGYREHESHHYDNTHNEDSRQGHDSTQGVFKHYADGWSSSESNQRHHNSGHGAQWSSGGDNTNRDNINEDQRHDNGQYGHSGHRSQERTHQYSGSNYNTGDASHSSDNHQSTSDSRHYSSSSSSSSWGQTGTSHSQDRNYRGGNYGDDASRKTNVRQYFSTNWDTDQKQENANRNQGTDQSNSRAEIGARRDQRVNEHGSQQSGGSGHFYTSSVLLGEDGNVDLGYAARGYGQNRDSFSSANSRQYSNRDNRKTTADPDLADLGAQFTERPEDSHDRNSQNSDSQFQLYGRFRRSISESSLEDLLKCNATNCTRIYCTLGPLVKGQEVRVALRMRVWVPTMKKLKDNRVIKTSSRMVMQVTKLPYIGSPHDALVHDHEVFTDIVSTDSPTIPDIVPLWVVVLSAVAGTIILLLLIFLLWKCGFFKRNRPADAAEKEPLNRNGHYSAGDEAL